MINIYPATEAIVATVSLIASMFEARSSEFAKGLATQWTHEAALWQLDMLESVR